MVHAAQGWLVSIKTCIQINYFFFKMGVLQQQQQKVVRKPLLHNVWHLVSWCMACWPTPTLWSWWWLPPVCGSPGGDETCSKATQDQDKVENWTWQRNVCRSNWSPLRAGNSISGFQGCVNKALCGTKQRKFSVLCALLLSLTGGEGSIAAS